MASRQHPCGCRRCCRIRPRRLRRRRTGVRGGLRTVKRRVPSPDLASGAARETAARRIVWFCPVSQRLEAIRSRADIALRHFLHFVLSLLSPIFLFLSCLLYTSPSP